MNNPNDSFQFLAQQLIAAKQKTDAAMKELKDSAAARSHSVRSPAIAAAPAENGAMSDELSMV